MYLPIYNNTVYPKGCGRGLARPGLGSDFVKCVDNLDRKHFISIGPNLSESNLDGPNLNVN